MEDHHTIVWEFFAKPGKEQEFERVYSAKGDWAVLFARSEGYLGTELHRDRQASRRYMVVDRWKSPQAFADFKRQFGEEYRVLDATCETLTETERHLGDFTSGGGKFRQRVSSGSPFESKIGFSRAVRAGSLISVAGTAAVGKDGKALCPGDAAGQARACFGIIREAVEKIGGQLGDVVRTRVFLLNIDDWPALAKVHGEYFADTRPACTVLQVARFVDPRWLVEIEVDAVVEER